MEDATKSKADTSSDSMPAGGQFEILAIQHVKSIQITHERLSMRAEKTY